MTGLKSARVNTLAAIGCTGPIGALFVEGLLAAGIHVRLLARNPENVQARYPGAEVFGGSMLCPADVARVMRGADAAFLITPIGPRNDKTVEIDAARAAVQAARESGLPHLIYVSVIGVDRPTGIPLLDSKRTIEQMLSDSGVPWTAIRCGSYMEDVIDSRVASVRRGLFIFPVDRRHPFHFTSQADVPRLVSELLKTGRPVNGPVDLIDPQIYTPAQVSDLMTRILGRRVRSSGKWPLYPLMLLLWPFFYWGRHRLSTIIPLIRYFNRTGYTGNPNQLEALFPGFKVTSLDQHLRDSLRQAPMRLSPLRSLLVTLGHLVTGRLHFLRTHVGDRVTLPDGRPSVIFRHAVVDPGQGVRPKPEATFIVRFHVAGMSVQQNIRFSLIPIPFITGLPGFRSKLWTYCPETGDFAGIYEWSTVQDAQNYAGSFAMRFMTRRSLPGSVSCEILATDRRSALGI